MRWILLVVFFLTLLSSRILGTAEVNPLSKITIKSNKAVCEKDKKNGEILIHYKENTLVTLADGSTIKADILTIIIKELPIGKKENEKKEEATLSNFKKVILKGNVLIKQNNRTITADQIEVFPQTKKCLISGNIKVEQKKEDAKDIPIIAESSKAIVDLENQEITFLGTKQKPVTTTIVIEGYPGLMKKIKTKEEKAEEKKAKKIASLEKRRIQKKSKKKRRA